jgi:hypothetical protein
MVEEEVSSEKKSKVRMRVRMMKMLKWWWWQWRRRWTRIWNRRGVWNKEEGIWSS